MTTATEPPIVQDLRARLARAAGSTERANALADLALALADADFHAGRPIADEAVDLMRAADYLVAQRSAFIAQALGTFLLRRGERNDLDEAISALERSMALLPPTDRPPPHWYSNLGAALLHRGGEEDVERAIEYHHRAVAIENEAPEERRTGQLGLLLSRLGDAQMTWFERQGEVAGARAAIATLNKAVEEAERSGQERVKVLNSLGGALTRWYRHHPDSTLLDDAVVCFRRALDIDPGDAKTWDNLATALHDRFSDTRRRGGGDQRDAVEALRYRRRLLRETPPDDPSCPVRLANLGQSVLTRHLTTGRRSYARLAARLFEQAASRDPGRPEYRANLAFASAAADPQDPSLGALFRQAFLATSKFDRGLALDAAEHWALWAEDRGAWEEAVEALSGATTILTLALQRQRGRPDQLSWLRRASGIAMRFAYALAKHGHLSRALEVLEERPVLTGGAPGRTEPPARGMADGVARVLVGATRLGGLALVDRSATDPTPVWLPQLTVERCYDQWGPFAAANTAWSQHPTSFARDGFMWAVTRMCKWSGETVVAPLLQEIGTPRAITFVPVGPLFGMPLHASAITDADGSLRYLLDDVVVSYGAPGHGGVSRGKELGGALVVAVPEAPDQRPLAAIDEEVAGVRAALQDVTVLHGSYATCVAVKDSLAGARVVHFACHGVADYFEPLNARLLLADGPLAVRDLLDVGLPNVWLAVLSACETAVGNIALPDDLLSFPAALRLAGAQNVVASSWLVDDQSTALLMARFSRLWSVDGLEPAEALHRAQRWLRDAPADAKRELLCELTADKRSAVAELAWPGASLDHTSPYYWAAFISL